jgi:hypothetical protein
MLSTKFSRPARPKRPRFDLSRLGPDARRQIEAQIGVVPAQNPACGRYRVSPVSERTVDSIVFASKWEAMAYVMLKRILGGDKIRRQVVFELQPAFVDVTGKKQAAISYVADFVLSLPDGEHVVDTKGHKTDIYRLKRKAFLFVHRRPLVEVYSEKQLCEFLEAHGVRV